MSQAPVQVDPAILALSQAANGQTNLPGNPVVDPETGEPVEDTRAGKPKDIQDFMSHPHYGGAQAPTSAVQVRHQSPSMQYVGSHVADSRPAATEAERDEPSDRHANTIQPTGNGGYAIPAGMSEAEAIAKTTAAGHGDVADAYRTQQTNNAASQARDNAAGQQWFQQITRGAGPTAPTSIASFGPGTAGGGTEVPTTQSAINQAMAPTAANPATGQVASPGKTFQEALQGISAAGGTPTGAASNFAPIIKNSGLSQPQQDSISDWLKNNPNAKPADVESSIRSEREATAQGTKAAQQTYVNQGNALKVKVDRAKRDLTKAAADLKENSGPLADDDARSKSQAEYDKANTAYGDAMDDLYEHANAGPQSADIASNAKPPVMPVNPRMVGQVQQGGSPPVVNSEADLQNITPGTKVQTPKGVMIWDGQRLTPVNQ